MLYFVLEKRTQDLLICLSQLDTSRLNMMILPNLSDPVYPEKFDAIIRKVNDANCPKFFKEKIIKAIKEGKKNMQ